VFDRALAAAARAIPDPRWRGEVVDVARRSAADLGRWGRAREVVATAGFGLRLRSLRATGGRAGEAWRQGARLGAALVLVTAWAGSVAAAGDDAGLAGVVTVLALAAALAAGAAGRWPALIASTAVALVVSSATAGWGPVTSAVAVALAAAVIGLRPGRGPRPVLGRRGRWLGLGAAGILGAASLAGAGDAVAGTTAVAATLVVPLVLVTLGGADARCAAAAAVAWVWRFLALDPGDVSAAASALARGEGSGSCSSAWPSWPGPSGWRWASPCAASAGPRCSARRSPVSA
jgi:hypothetical protein